MRSLAALFMFFAFCVPAQAATTVTVEDSSPSGQVVVTQTAAQPVFVTAAAVPEFEGEIERIDRAGRTMDVVDTEGKTRKVWVTQETLDTYRTGDYVRIYPIAGAREVTFVRAESNRDLEGRIINVDHSKSTLVVHDKQGRDRRVTLKQGMINNYKVDDYVRIHLMADLKEAKTIQTVR